MTCTANKRYPVGIQTFSEIVEGGYVYIDKTAQIHRICNGPAKYVFLSRPRRFGKSLLSSTIRSYFEGRSDLFKGLAMESLETKWEQYPVFHFDLSLVKELPIDEISAGIRRWLRQFEQKYGVESSSQNPGYALNEIIRAIYERDGLKSVIIVDEYDAPLLSHLHDEQECEQVRSILKEFYSPLKLLDPCLRFCFLTGITKFSQLSIFSTINNLSNISMLPQYSTLCGITEQELYRTFSEDIADLATCYKCTPEEMKTLLKQRYDGYHFSKDAPGVYNPFSLLSVLNDRMLNFYWFSSGTPTFLLKQMERFGADFSTIEGSQAAASSFDQPTEGMTSVLPLLYQSGYLTIKDYDFDSSLYTLTIPNSEVRSGLMMNILPKLTGKTDQQNDCVAAGVKLALMKGDVPKAMEVLKSYYATIPYDEFWGGSRPLKELSAKEKVQLKIQREIDFKRLFYTRFSFMNVQIYTEVHVAGGRTDAVMFFKDTIYVIEAKLNAKSARVAIDQIDANGYATPYLSDGRRVVKLGINFSSRTHTIKDYIAEQA